MLIKLFLLKQIIFFYLMAATYLQNSPTIFPYKYNTNLHLFFIHKFLFIPKFSIISLFLETPPKSLLSIPLDSLKREDSRTIFKIPFQSLTRPHAPQEGRRLPSQLPRVTTTDCHVIKLVFALPTSFFVRFAHTDTRS